jgi:hypothetical protein
LDLPIDHFRLLGVSPASDAQHVLRTLQQRLDRLPHQGFTPETLQARAELLRASADLLSDSERRTVYEAALTSLARAEEPVVPALDVATPLEMGGLLLLLEANQPLECFEMACRCLQPPQAPALGSGREADLTLLAGLSCLEAAGELREQRRYEGAAGILQQGLQLLQRMGQQPDLRQAMNRELEQLTPYRVLDLLSRDLGAVEERREGLALLEQMVERRGGLEGDGDPDFSFSEFQAFFKQIRSFLTVQEQVDLFSRWADAGSEAADFLATTALTASGFAQRKPERIATARNRLLASGRSGIEPLLANLHLLLGDVDAAKSRFAAGATQELQTWAAAQSEDPLGRVCAYCRDWLLRDVLPGYRDLDADPDLEPYFSDRDVEAFVEREDHLRGRGLAPGITAGQAAGPGTLPGSFGGGSGSAFGGLFPDSPFDASGYGSGSLSSADPQAKEGGGFLLDEEADTEEVGLNWSLPHWKLPDAQWLIAAVAGLGLLLLAGTLVFRPRQGPAPIPERAAGVPARPKPAAAPAAREGSSAQRSLPLRSAAPSEPEIRTLLEAWLKAKSTVMAGEEAPALLEEIARPAPIERLNSERDQDKARGETQVINVRVKDLSISERSPLRIAVTADLDYSDSRRDATGKERESTAPTTLRNEYVFGRDGDVWRVAASSSAN